MNPSQAYFVPDSHYQVEPLSGCHRQEHSLELRSRQWSPSSDDSIDSWTPVRSSPHTQFPASLSTIPTVNSAYQTNNHDGNPSLACIFAHCLIPGRGEPIFNAAVGISLDTGSITFVGPQSELPRSLTSVPRVSTLMAGITSVRDVGSYATEVAPLVERGIILGPNIFGAGGAIGITGGSCDACTLPSDFVYSRQGTSGGNPWPGVSALVLADGVDECRTAVRQQIRRGAQCIKVVATGGVLSTQDNPKYRQYSDAELAALVDEATLQGRSVAIHAHGKDGIMAAVKAGAHTIEHGSYIDDEAAELMAEKGVTLVATRHVIEAGLKNLDKLNPPTAKKMVNIAESHLRAYQTAVRKGVKIALGTDIAASDPTSDTAHGKNGDEVAYAVKAGLSPLQAIEAGTINSAETLGALAPKKGLIKKGWDADLIAVEENPLDDVHLFSSPANIKYVWKGGLLVKSPQGQLLWPTTL
ncbi:hypothetical protein LCI18_006522 [Fusarium solani-melongenae]|uniref:Uncharacterized protein n=1 Tax=Fusarium solani subsp. cucurbitae TaxID=2747967 RepID=A0ACD3Z3C3_FUSSC|nr:hypothetical protein LCI18_006522 [Fusarium solani-melongenae]